MSTLEDEKAENFIQERLDSLYEIDCKVVSLLDQFSTIFQSFYTKDKEQFSEQTTTIYSTLSKVAIDLRKEIKIMDDNIGVHDKNDDGVMILPITNVDQKEYKIRSQEIEPRSRGIEKLITEDQLSESQEDIDMKE